VIERIKELAKKEAIEFTHHARLVIDNLPAKVCLHCGESIVDYNTMEKIEKIIEKFKHKEIASTKFTAYEIDAMATAPA
jgi:YgiT-type zinc finger domain-containing protein